MAPVRALSASPFGTLLITGDWHASARHLAGLVQIAVGDGSVRTAQFELVPAV